MYSHRAFRTNIVFQVLFYNITSLASARPTFRTDFLKMIDIRYIDSICTARSYKTYKSCKHASINEGGKSLKTLNSLFCKLGKSQKTWIEFSKNITKAQKH